MNIFQGRVDAFNNDRPTSLGVAIDLYARPEIAAAVMIGSLLAMAVKTGQTPRQIVDDFYIDLPTDEFWLQEAASFRKLMETAIANGFSGWINPDLLKEDTA